MIGIERIVAKIADNEEYLVDLAIINQVKTNNSAVRGANPAVTPIKTATPLPPLNLAKSG